MQEPSVQGGASAHRHQPRRPMSTKYHHLISTGFGAPPEAPFTPLARFSAKLAGPDLEQRLHNDLIGSGAAIEGPFGRRRLVYADYVASGRALGIVENFILEEVLPYYANSHTEASHCGGYMTRLRRAARDLIGTRCGAGPEHAVVFAGSGATAGLNRLVHLLGLGDKAEAGRATVLVGPYEHHSNILPWRESGANVIEIDEGPDGGPDLDLLDAVLAEQAGRGPLIGAFSAASNVTGIVTDVVAVTRRLKAAGAKVVWDYAGGAPYLPIAMNPAPDAPIDAVVLSPHKFVGGPGASGVLIVRRDAVSTQLPSWSGGGTVRFASPESHDYSEALEAREEAGTPNVVGDVRAALVFMVRDALGTDWIAARNAERVARAHAAWSNRPALELLGHRDAPRLPFFSFRIKGAKGSYVHQQLVTRMLSDLYGIQARGGCACAGPYVHRLLGISSEKSRKLRARILSGHELEKPGFTRLNLSHLASDDEVEFILNSVIDLSERAPDLVRFYKGDPSTAIFTPVASSSAA